MASVRFICGTQALHRALEQRLSSFLGTEDTILYSSCFDANGGLFEALLDERDAVISDQLNHASIIDGIRLCKARRLRYAKRRHGRARGAPAGGRRRALPADRDRRRLLDGRLPRPPRRDICELAERHDALVMVDDSHAVGVVGPGRARHARAARRRRARRHPHRHARQGDRRRQRRLRLGPARDRRAAAPALAALPLLQQPRAARRRREPARARADRELRASCATACAPTAHASAHGMDALGFELLPGEHPIVPVMVGDEPRPPRLSREARRARRLRGQLLLPGRATRRRPHPHADVGRPQRRATSTSRPTASHRRGPRSPAELALGGNHSRASLLVATRRAALRGCGV